MLSVLIETRNDEERLARTLAVLVGAVVEGVVREVIVCDRGSTDQTHYVAEHAGCRYLAEGGVAAGIGIAKSDWLLFLEAGARPMDGWTDAVMNHINRSTQSVRFRRSRASRVPFLARVLSANRALELGLLITRRQASALAKSAADAESMARGLAVKTLEAEISPAERGS